MIEMPIAMAFFKAHTGKIEENELSEFMKRIIYITALVLVAAFKPEPAAWQSKFVSIAADGTLSYTPDKDGNILPDFSRVGYHQGDKPLPDIAVVKTISP